ncbi:MAG TPA: hypothetical protein VLC95_11615 [Anaerolineae bacterium]|nr:hypothetical protein [Anaerolineae bacterium]
MLDTGDALIGGGILGDLTQGEVIVAGMNQMGYDAMALGPKELSLGLDVLRLRLAEAEFPIVSANVVDTATGELLVPPHVVLDVGPYRVAVVGLTRVPDADLRGVRVLPPAEVAPAAVAAAAAGADLVILLANLSFKSAQSLLANLPQVDLLVGALPGQLPAQAARVPGTSALAVTAEQPMERHTGRRVGRLAVTLNPGGTLGHEQWSSISITPDIQDDVEMRALLDTFRP